MKQIIRINENDLHRIVKQVLKEVCNCHQFGNSSFLNEALLLEGDSRLKKLEQIIRQQFKEYGFDVDEIVSSETYYVNNNPNTTWLDYAIFLFRHSFGLMSNQDVKYIPEFGRIAFSELGFEGPNSAQGDLHFLKRVVQIVKQQPELFDKYVKGKGYKAIYQYFSPIVAQQDNDERERINNADYSNIPQDYDILEDVNYEMARKIGKYSSPKGKLCYTQSSLTWNEYTENGKNAVYILLKRGWKAIKPVHTECLLKHLDEQDGESPYDEYGLSMIFVFVSKNGNLITCNTRWNHDAAYPLNKDVDLALNKEEISNLIGKPFDSVFKPHKMTWQEKWSYVQKNNNLELVELTDSEEHIYNVIDITKGKAIFPKNFSTYLNLQDTSPTLWLWIICPKNKETPYVIIDKTNHIYQYHNEIEEQQYLIFYDENGNKYRFKTGTRQLTPYE